MEFDTLEKAQAEIIRLQEANNTLTTERDTLSQDNEKLTGELNESRKLNHEYFLKLRAQNSPEADKKDDEEEVPTCEEFAKTITL